MSASNVTASSAVETSPTSQAPPPTTTSQQQPTTLTTSAAPPPATTTQASAPPPPPPSSSQTSIITTTAPTTTPRPTSVATSVVVTTATRATSDGETILDPTTVIVTLPTSQTESTPTTFRPTTASSSASSTSSGAALQNGEKSSTGKSSGGKIAIAVVIPIVVVALLVLAGLFWWRRRRQRHAAEEARRKEMEDYGFNPNNDPTLPAVTVGEGSEMAEDQSGYRGWGNTTTLGAPTTRKTSTTVSGGAAGYSDNGSQPGGYHSPGSPTGGISENSGDPLMGQQRRGTMDSETIGALGAGPAAGQNNRGDIRRGPSNASSRYSTGAQSEHSSEPPIPMHNPQDYYQDAYYQPGPYGNGYGQGGEQPVIRDVSARRNTRIENPTHYPQQGNTGIAQNF